MPGRDADTPANLLPHPLPDQLADYFVSDHFSDRLADHLFIQPRKETKGG